jgi:hypothetical protein
MKIIYYEAVNNPERILYIVECKWDIPSYYCNIIFDNFKEALFYEKALANSCMQVFYSSCELEDKRVKDYDRILLLYTMNLLNSPIYSHKRFTHKEYLWRDMGNSWRPTYEDAIWGSLPCGGTIQSSEIPWVKFAFDGTYTYCQSPYAKNLT